MEGNRTEWTVPAQLRRRAEERPDDPATLEALAALFPTARIRNVYSTTDCWPRRLATDFDRDRPGSLGRPSAGAAMEVSSRATEELGREIEVRDLLDATSLCAFAVRVDAAAAREAVGRRD
jgi:hypothetical protein